MSSDLASSKDMKIVLSGLDNAGKTSMMVVMKKMYQFLEDVSNLEPTIRIDYYQREFLGFNINFWDMGGQEKYRERYLKRDIYFDNIDTFIYLIDIKDEERFDESIEYLEKILKIFEEVQYNKENPIYICFSKMDYDQAFTEKPEYIKNLAVIRKDILEKFSDFNFEFFTTSIFNIYSIIKMISGGLRKFIPEYEALMQFLMEYSEKNNFDQILLYDDTGLIIGEYSNSLKERKPQFYDDIISEHLEYHKRIEDEENKRFRYTRKTDDDMMDVNLRFTHPIVNEDEMEIRNNYYVSIIMDKDVGHKSEWNRLELVKNLKQKLKDIITQ